MDKKIQEVIKIIQEKEKLKLQLNVVGDNLKKKFLKQPNLIFEEL